MSDDEQVKKMLEAAAVLQGMKNRYNDALHSAEMEFPESERDAIQQGITALERLAGLLR